VTRGSKPALSGPRLALPAIIAVAVVGFVILSVVAGSSSSPDRRAGAVARKPSIGLRPTKLGRIVVDTAGRTLYLFLADTKGKSTCYGGCARVWPAALVDGKPKAGPGIIARKLTTVARRGTRLRQLVYNNHPLYRVDADRKPGDTEGQGVFNSWFVVGSDGTQVGKASKGAGGY
jgi:predicted lipoprotein with Yx(FWY)xxD motif